MTKLSSLENGGYNRGDGYAGWAAPLCSLTNLLIFSTKQRANIDIFLLITNYLIFIINGTNIISVSRQLSQKYQKRKTFLWF